MLSAAATACYLGAESTGWERDAERGKDRLGAIFGHDADVAGKAGGGQRRGVAHRKIAAGMVVQPLEGAHRALGRRKIRDAERAQLIDIVASDRRAFVQAREDHRLGRLEVAHRAQDRRQLDADRHRIGLDDAGHHAAEPVVAEQGGKRAIIKVRFHQPLRGDVERV